MDSAQAGEVEVEEEEPHFNEGSPISRASGGGGSSAGSHESYQRSTDSYSSNGGGGRGTGGSSSPARRGRRRRGNINNNSGGNVIVQVLRRAFSIENYTEVAEDSNNDGGDYNDDDEEEEGDDGIFRDSPSLYHSTLHHNPLYDEPSSFRKCRVMGISVLLLFFAAAIMVSIKTNKQKAITIENDVENSGADEQEQELICKNDKNGALSSLFQHAVAEGSSLLEHNGAAVATDHAECSQMGLAILRDKGGHAVDAAVTVALCLGVANPASSGLGGGGFMLVHADASPMDNPNNDNNIPSFIDARTGPSPKSASGKITEVIDFREVAPAAATTDMYDTNLHSNVATDASTFGGLAIPVPGELRGLELAHKRHGKLPWSDVVEPVMRLAIRGLEVAPYLAAKIELMQTYYTKNSDDSTNTKADYGLKHLLTRGDSWSKPLRLGERLQNQKLGELLEAVMSDGANALYTGDRAETLAQEIQSAGGIVTKADLESYRATLRSPVVAHDVNGFSFVGVPPPSSGSAAIIGAARFLAGFAAPLAAFGDTLSMHRVVEACKHAFAIRMSLCDPDYDNSTNHASQNATDDLTRGYYMEELRRTLYRDNTTLPLSAYGGPRWAQLHDSDGGSNNTANASDAQEGDRRQRQRRRLADPFGYLNDGGTSHFSIVDKDGNAVSMTTSINTEFGSKVVSKAFGFVLGNTMDDFANPGKPNFFGLKPSPANYIQPGKKPLSSMAPTMVFRHDDDDINNDDNGGVGADALMGDLVLVIGGSGGPKIISAVLQVIMYNIFMGKSLFESMVYPRVHDQLIYHNSAVTTTENSMTLAGGVDGDGQPETNLVVSKRTRDALTRRMHELLEIDYAGTTQAVAIDLETRRLTAVSDVRKGGSPAAY